ncbi:MAG TPA: bL35 family ribosomal protein [Planctomycetota bacterium]|jgi:large subunit ribosomal protein L35
MPKQKSKGSVKKRFRISKHGKVLCSKNARGHMHAHHTGKQRRSLRKPLVLEGVWARLIKQMMEA